MRWNTPSAGLVLFLFERSGRMGKVLIWFVIIISTVVLYCLMKVKAESDELYEELMRKHFMVDWMIFLHLTKLST